MSNITNLSDYTTFQQAYYDNKKHFELVDHQLEEVVAPDRETEQLKLPYGRGIMFAGSMDLPPGINASYRPGSDLHPIVGTSRLQQFKENAALLLSQGYHDWRLINAIRQSKYKVPLRVDLHFFFKTLWKQDVDGPIKACLDATFTRLGLDDRLVIDLHTYKRIDPDRPRVEVEVYCILPS